MDQHDLAARQAEYEALCGRLEPRLAELGATGDREAKEMRKLFAEARAAWEDDDRAGAKTLSERGHAAKARSQAANAEADELRQVLRTALEAVKFARGRQVIIRAPQAALSGGSCQHVHGADVVGFVNAKGWTRFLETLPASVFNEIRAIEYVDAVDAESRAGVTTDLLDRSRKARIRIYRFPIELDGAALVNQRAWTLVHEYAHVVYERALDGDARLRWGDLYLRRRKDSSQVWVTNLARTSLREDFSECFAAYVVKRQAFLHADPEKYGIIKEIFEAL